MDTSNIITSNIVSGRTRKGKGTVYDQAGNPLISHRDITQLDEDEVTVHTDDRQNRTSGTNATDNRSTGNNDEDDEDEEEEDVELNEEEEEEDEEEEDEEEEDVEMQNEDDIRGPTVNFSTTFGNEDNNVLGTNNVIDEITTVSDHTETHTVWGKARGEAEIAKSLQDVNTVLTTSAVDDIKRLFTWFIYYSI